MPYIKRNLEKIVQEVTLEYPVILLAGPRQVGKTTMLMKLMEGSERGTVKYYAQIHLQVWQNSVCTGQGNLPLIT